MGLLYRAGANESGDRCVESIDLRLLDYSGGGYLLQLAELHRF
jgi:hypothetical protein